MEEIVTTTNTTTPQPQTEIDHRSKNLPIITYA